MFVWLIDSSKMKAHAGRKGAMKNTLAMVGGCVVKNGLGIKVPIVDHQAGNAAANDPKYDNSYKYDNS